MNNNVIDSFSGDYEFLSNFYKAIVVYEGLSYPTSEHAYQAAKTLNKDERLSISRINFPRDAKKAGKYVTLRENWEDIKLDVMKEIVMIKFSDGYLAKELLNTGDAELIEGNNWKDTYWGVYKGKGKNNLGKILMETRKILKERMELNNGKEEEFKEGS